MTLSCNLQLLDIVAIEMGLGITRSAAEWFSKNETVTALLWALKSFVVGLRVIDNRSCI